MVDPRLKFKALGLHVLQCWTSGGKSWDLLELLVPMPLPSFQTRVQAWS